MTIKAVQIFYNWKMAVFYSTRVFSEKQIKIRRKKRRRQLWNREAIVITTSMSTLMETLVSYIPTRVLSLTAEDFNHKYVETVVTPANSGCTCVPYFAPSPGPPRQTEESRAGQRSKQGEKFGEWGRPVLRRDWCQDVRTFPVPGRPTVGMKWLSAIGRSKETGAQKLGHRIWGTETGGQEDLWCRARQILHICRARETL